MHVGGGGGCCLSVSLFQTVDIRNILCHDASHVVVSAFVSQEQRLTNVTPVKGRQVSTDFACHTVCHNLPTVSL